MTPILYVICKAKLSAIFREVFNRVSLGHTEAYTEIMTLHQDLYKARDSLSPRLRMTSFEEAVTVSPFLLARRFSLELFFQKTVCMLHRQHMVKSFQESKYDFSRSCCVDAAMTVLQHQANIHREAQPGGLLHEGRWPVTSIEQTDFVLAATIICVELSHRQRAGGTIEITEDERDIVKFNNQDLARALQHAQMCLDELKHTSSECLQAFNVLSGMLRRFSIDSVAVVDQGSVPQDASYGNGTESRRRDGMRYCITIGARLT